MKSTSMLQVKAYISIHRIISFIKVVSWAIGTGLLFFSGIYFSTALPLHIFVGAVFLWITISFYFRDKAFHRFVGTTEPADTEESTRQRRKLVIWDLVVSGFSTLMGLAVTYGMLSRILGEKTAILG
jgi:hypothetical protein